MSAERIDHAKEAREWNNAASGPALSMEQTSAFAAIAQVHATLALVEQQRTANLIAFHDLSTRQDQSVLDETAHDRIQRAGAEIREALGLA